MLLLVALCFGQVVRVRGVEWLTDAAAAQAKAKEENKLVLLDFTGSDWCGWCIKLKREVFDQPDFGRYAQSKLVMVEVDFPHNKALSAGQQQANARLQQNYRITGYPTLILLDGDGKQVGQMGYVPGGPSAFIAKLQKTTGAQGAVVKTEEPAEPEKPKRPVVWTPPPAAVPIHYGPLALKGISGTRERRIVQINNASLMAGETAKVRTQEREVVVCCKEIHDDSVMIICDGKPMELRLAVR
jgi:thioredoxin-related protein